MKYDQLSDKEKELIDLFNQADSDTQDFLVWAAKYIVENNLETPIDFNALENIYYGTAV